MKLQVVPPPTSANRRVPALRYRSLTRLLIAGWLALVMASLGWHLWQLRRYVEEFARIEARAIHGKDVTYRRWATLHGGVYVPVADHTPPNPYLDVPHRDVTTTSGQALTLMNPAYMVRQVHAMDQGEHGIRGHITSLNPIRPENAADDWETQALNAFELGSREVSTVERMEGRPFMRLMRPMITEEGCLKCHARQGYREGDVRGGISVSVPMDPYLQNAQAVATPYVLTHLFTGALGTAGIWFGRRRLERHLDERSKVEHSLSEQRWRLQNIIEGTAVGTWEWNVQTGDLVLNERWAQMLGYSLEELGPISIRTWESLCHPDDHRASAERLRCHFDGTLPYYELDCRMRHKQGHWIWVHDRGRVVTRSPDGKPLLMFGTHSDITARRAQEAEILRLNRLYLALSEVNQLITRVHDRDRLLTGVCQLLVWHGGLKMAWIGWHDRDLGQLVPVAYHGDAGGYLDRLNEQAWAVREGAAPPATALREGREVVFNNLAALPPEQPWCATALKHGFLSCASVPIREENTLCGTLTVYASEPDFFHEKEVLLFEDVARDVSFALTHLKRESLRQAADAALREKTLELDRYFQSALDLLCIADTRGFFRRLNPEWQNTLGYPLSFLKGIRYLDLVHPDDLEATQHAMRDLIEQKPVLRFMNRYRHQDGSYRWIEWRAIPQGELIYAVARDMTEHRKALDDLRESEHRLELASRAAGIGIWDWNLVTHWMTWDDAMFRLYGFPERLQCGGLAIWEKAVHPDDKDRVWAAREAALRGTRDYAIEFRITHPDGSVRHVQSNGMVLRDAGGRPVRMLGTTCDVTERKALEDQLRQVQRLESIGQLAGGVAHDFNNILAAMILHLGLLQQNPDLDADTQDSLKELMSHSERAANLTRQLLMFSRRSMLEAKILDLNEVVGNFLKMLSRLIGEHIAVRFDRAAGLPPVEADPTMMEQVLMNLCVNARDAMPKGGTLTITLQTIDAKHSQIRAPIRTQSGQFVCLSVTDTGCGIEPATLQRVFEPFFTTKDVGKGTGLGLATVHGIVGQHGGWVDVQSTVGQGTTFRVFLPALLPEILSRLPARQPQALPGNELILLVEDEPAIRRAITHSLQRLGYKILEAASGAEALQLWSRHRHEIDLLLTDMVMPGKQTGLELAERLRKENPQLKVILSSGYNNELTHAWVLAGKSIATLPKPYAIEALSETIRRCLDGTGDTRHPGGRHPTAPPQETMPGSAAN